MKLSTIISPLRDYNAVRDYKICYQHILSTPSFDLGSILYRSYDEKLKKKNRYSDWRRRRRLSNHVNDFLSLHPISA